MHKTGQGKKIKESIDDRTFPTSFSTGCGVIVLMNLFRNGFDQTIGCCLNVAFRNAGCRVLHAQSKPEQWTRFVLRSAARL